MSRSLLELVTLVQDPNNNFKTDIPAYFTIKEAEIKWKCVFFLCVLKN